MWNHRYRKPTIKSCADFTFFNIILSIYLFIYGCAGASLLHGLFSSCSERGLFFVVVCMLLIVVASLGGEHGLYGMQASEVSVPRIQSTCSIVRVHRAQLLRGMWDRPESGIEPVSPALAGGFFTTETPGKQILNCTENQCL